MDSSVLHSQWTRMRKQVKQFFDLKDDDLAQLDASADKADALLNILEHRYGLMTDEARDKLDKFITKHGATTKV